jgi:hypothetical protein
MFSIHREEVPVATVLVPITCAAEFRLLFKDGVPAVCPPWMAVI